MIVIAVIIAAILVVSYTCCKVSHKGTYGNEDCGIWDEW